MRFDTLAQWLQWQEGLHPKSIDLGLERVAKVWHQLQPNCHYPTIITVGGTNGKGSTVEILSRIYQHSGYRVACYTSPHLVRYNERIRINQIVIEDSALVEHFHAVDQARGKLSLTYFEFGTLAAMNYFLQQAPDLIILEVGMGGRLDAVNLYPNDVAIITNVGLDHQAWLGDNVEQIASEKAGIMRPHRPVVFNQRNPPQAILDSAQNLDARLFTLGQQYDYDKQSDSWRWQSGQRQIELAYPRLRGDSQIQNAAAALMACELLQDRLPLSENDIHIGLQQAQIPGRLERVNNVILDVAHNAQSVENLAEFLQKEDVSCYAVFGALADKDLNGLIEPLIPFVQGWYLTDLSTPRAQSLSKIRETLLHLHCPYLGEAKNPQQAVLALRDMIGPEDIILVYGSFYTVADVVKTADKLTG